MVFQINLFGFAPAILHISLTPSAPELSSPISRHVKRHHTVDQMMATYVDQLDSLDGQISTYEKAVPSRLRGRLKEADWCCLR